jgi:ribosome-associated toxin RatA of RatAB toxin-antitoxin module
MREVKRSALVSQPPARVFTLINDIERYPEFLPWCTHARVLSRTPEQIVATLGVRQGALTGEFTTRNTLVPDTGIHMHLVSGPFRTLEGEWRLSPIASHGCQVEFAVKFEFRNRLSGLLFEPLFAQTIGSLVDAFVQRARAPA